MLTVWKYPLPPVELIELDMPHGARVLTVQKQGTNICMWALVNPAHELERRGFQIIGTGHEIESVGEYVGTFQVEGGAFVFHVFGA
jgi:hypothetical protein